MDKIVALPAVLPERRERGRRAHRHLLVENALLARGLRGEPAAYELGEKAVRSTQAGDGDLLFQHLICLVTEEFLVADFACGPGSAAVRVGREAVRAAISDDPRRSRSRRLAFGVAGCSSPWTTAWQRGLTNAGSCWSVSSLIDPRPRTARTK